MAKAVQVKEKGARVILIAEGYSNSKSNPIWGRCYECVGTVIRSRNDGRIEVEWDNGTFNAYSHEDVDYYNENDYIRRGCFKIKNGEYKGRKVEVVVPLKDSSIVLFNEDIGGFSLDGKYPKGRCLIIENEALEPDKSKKR